MHVRKHFIPAIGSRRIAEVDTQLVDDFLFSLDISNRTRWNVASTLQAILKEAVRRRIIKALPLFELPQKKSRKPNILTLEDLRRLFPRDRKTLADIWAPTRAGEPAEARLAIVACAATMFFGGLRP
jgi:hypothetical protein